MRAPQLYGILCYNSPLSLKAPKQIGARCELKQGPEPDGSWAASDSPDLVVGGSPSQLFLLDDHKKKKESMN